MEHQSVDWLTTGFLTECLKHEEGKENILVTNFTTTSAVPPGNNYASCICRVKVEYKIGNKTSHVSLIIKSDLSDSPVKDMLDTDLTEAVFYRQFIPAASKFSHISFAPKSFISPKPSVIVLEDLKESGYVLSERVKQLDFEHCRVYVLAAASLHAVSLTVHKENPEFIESLGKEKMYSNDAKTAENFKIWLKCGFKCLIDCIKKMSEMKKYSKVIELVHADLWEMLVDAVKPIEGLNTLNQGDVWTTNMMFKYGHDGVVNAVKLLDYQMPRYASPATDLVYFIWTSANHDVKRNRLDELYRIYLQAFNSKLKELGCSESMSYAQLKHDITKLSPLALFVVVTFLPLMLDPAPVDLANFLQMCGRGENPYENYYNENFCTNHMQRLFEQLEGEGVFEYLEKYKKEH